LAERSFDTSRAYTVKQAAEAVGVSTRTIQRRIEDGSLRVERYQNGFVRIDGKRLEKMAKAFGYLVLVLAILLAACLIACTSSESTSDLMMRLSCPLA